MTPHNPVHILHLWLDKETRLLTTTQATTGYENQLWQMADALRGSMDAAEYKHCR